MRLAVLGALWTKGCRGAGCASQRNPRLHIRQENYCGRKHVVLEALGIAGRFCKNSKKQGGKKRQPAFA